jgi:forkhead box protein N
MAIEDSVQKALPVKEIYAWIIQHFPYFKTAPTGWKNSVRHNLSLNKCFQKVEKAAVSENERNFEGFFFDFSLFL